MKLVVDCREPVELINSLENYINSRANNSTPIILEKTALDIGDAIIYLDDTDLLNPNKQIIFERKSLSDLIASIKDGRYNEQSFRLDQYSIHNHHIYYIIEGNIERFCKNPRYNNPNIQQTIYSTMFTLSYYKGFSLINSQNIQETATYIFRFLDKLSREKSRKAHYIREDSNINNQTHNLNIPITPSTEECIDIDINIDNSKDNKVTTYSDCIKTSKKSNITIDNILEIMLIQIPGVCPAAAQVITLTFKTMKNLIDNLEANPDCLNNIMIQYSKNRRLSKTAKANIFKYILQKDKIIEINT